jgi:uncharacterized protein (TIGR02284 family)
MVDDAKATPASTLNELIETCKDGANGYRAAAEVVTESSLKATFTGFASQRDQFATELQGLYSRVGGAPAPEEEHGSILGVVHRGWLAAKGWIADKVTGHDEIAVLAECERGDEHAVKAYEDAIFGNLPQSVQPVLMRQAAEVKRAYEMVKKLKASREAKKAKS